MKKLVLLICGLLLFGLSLHLTAQDNNDKAAIKAVIQSAYVEGVHINQDSDAIRAGLHDSFVMFVGREDGVVKITRDDWISRIEGSKERTKEENPPKVTADIEVLDIANNAALARVYLYRDGLQVFTDFMSLYKFADGWKVVAKTFQKHPFKGKS